MALGLRRGLSGKRRILHKSDLPRNNTSVHGTINQQSTRSYNSKSGRNRGTGTVALVCETSLGAVPRVAAPDAPVVNEVHKVEAGGEDIGRDGFRLL